MVWGYFSQATNGCIECFCPALEELDWTLEPLSQLHIWSLEERCSFNRTFSLNVDTRGRRKGISRHLTDLKIQKWLPAANFQIFSYIFAGHTPHPSNWLPSAANSWVRGHSQGGVNTKKASNIKENLHHLTSRTCVLNAQWDPPSFRLGGSSHYKFHFFGDETC